MAPRSLSQALAGALGALGGVLYLHFVRALPWTLAAIVGVALGALVVTSWRTGEQIRAAWRGTPPETEAEPQQRRARFGRLDRRDRR